MNYYNGFPATYQPMVPMMQQPQVQIQPQMQVQPQPQSQVKPREVSETERLIRAAQEGTIPPLRTGQNTDAAMRTPQPASSQTISVSVPVKTQPAPERNVGVIEEKLDSLHSLLEERIGVSNKGENTDSTGRPAEQKTQDNAEMLTFVKLLYNTLIANEVDEIYVNQLTDEVENLIREIQDAINELIQ